MLKKVWLYIVGLLLVLGAAGAIFLAIQNTKGHDDKLTLNAATTNVVKQNKACQIFTVANARSLLGADVKEGENPADQSTQDLIVSTCTYRQVSSAADTSDRKSASLLIRAPKTAKGSASNDNEFGALRPANVQDAPGYGEQAFWNARNGELNVLKNHIWYILSYGPSTPTARTLDQTRQMADMLAGRL